MPKLKRNTPPQFIDPALQEHQELRRRSAGSLKRKNRNNRAARRSEFRPFLAVLVAALLCCVCIVNTLAGVVLTEVSSGYEYISDEESWDGFSVGNPVYFRDKELLVVSVPVTKQNPYMESYGGEIDLQVTVNGSAPDYIPSLYLPSLDFTDSTVWVSESVSVGDADLSSISVAPVFSADYMPSSYSIQEYDWLLDEAGTDAELLSAWKEWYEDAGLSTEMVDDSVLKQDGRVIFRINADEETYLYGSYNILFKKDGEVIFADVAEYSSPHDEDTSLAVSYDSPYTLPEYDEVEIVLLGQE